MEASTPPPRGTLPTANWSRWVTGSLSPNPTKLAGHTQGHRRGAGQGKLRLQRAWFRGTGAPPGAMGQQRIAVCPCTLVPTPPHCPP